MKVLDLGHLYEVEDLDGHVVTQIQFIKKRPHGVLPDELVIETDGTTNEEVLRVLIDRLRYLYAALPSDETQAAKRHCEAALESLEIRTRGRRERGVEGKNVA